MPKEKIDLIEYALKSYVDQFKELNDSWKSLDTKAQGSIVISNIFLAVAFAWSRQSISDLSAPEKSIFLIAIILLGTSIVFSVMSLRVKEVPHPPLGKDVLEMIEDVISAGANERRYLALKYDEIRLWQETNESMESGITEKGRLTVSSHNQIMLAGASFIVLTFIQIIRG